MRFFSFLLIGMILLNSVHQLLQAQEGERGHYHEWTGSYHDRDTNQRTSAHRWDRIWQRGRLGEDHRSDESQRFVRCTDVNCKYFGQVVPADHLHWFKDVDINCKYFNQYVPPGHQHWHRCFDIACKDFNQFIPPWHKHVH